MNREEGIEGASCQSKHIRLSYSIMMLNELANHIDDIICQISGNEKKKSEPSSEKPVTPSLLTVLENGSDQILAIKENCHKKLDILKQLLF